MHWKCKYCPFSSEKRAQLFKHYRLKHGSYARTEPFPCLHQECLCTFRSLSALNTHLCRFHRRIENQQSVDFKFRCLSCDFLEPCSETEYFSHLRNVHLKVNHSVNCPYKDCNFRSSVYSTFNAHKCKEHRELTWENFKPEIIVRITTETSDEVSHVSEVEQEMMKKKPNDSLIKKEMDITFALRRNEVVKDKPDISQMVKRWPALFTESQVCVTFHWFFFFKNGEQHSQIRYSLFSVMTVYAYITNLGFFFVFFRFIWSLTGLLEEILRMNSLTPLMPCVQAWWNFSRRREVWLVRY